MYNSLRAFMFCSTALSRHY